MSMPVGKFIDLLSPSKAIYPACTVCSPKSVFAFWIIQHCKRVMPFSLYEYVIWYSYSPSFASASTCVVLVFHSKFLLP